MMNFIILILIIIINIIVCESFRYNKFSSYNSINRKYKYLQPLKITASRTVLQKEGRVIERKHDDYNHLLKQTPVRYLVAGKSLQLTEIINDNRYSSLVDFTSNGNMIFTHFSGDDVKNVRGTWSEGRNRVLKMVIERTYTGRSSEFTTKSIYVGVTDTEEDDDVHGEVRIKKEKFNVVFIGGEIGDESCDIGDIDDTAGKFVLSTGPTTFSNMNYERKRKMITSASV